MDYLNQHSSSLHWEKKLDIRTPREKQSQDTRPSKQEKRKDRPDKRADRSKERTGAFLFILAQVFAKSFAIPRFV
jgi:hypothetical protein